MVNDIWAWMYLSRSWLLSVGLDYVPLLAVRVELVDLVFIVDHVNALPVLQNVIFELYEFLWLTHRTSVTHSLDLLRICIYDEALRSEVGIKEATEYHDLCVIDSKASQLTPLCVSAWPRQVYVLPVRCSIEIMTACKIEPLNCAETAPVVYCRATSNRVNKWISKGACRKRVSLFD